MSKRKWIIALLLLTFAVLSPIGTVYGEDHTDYSISAYKAEVTLYPDGSVYFDEYITYRLLQERVVIRKPVLMSNASSIEDMEISSQELVNSEDGEPVINLNQLEQVDDFADDSKGVYTYTLADEEEDIYHIAVPVQGAKRDEVTYVYRYKLKDTVFLYKDTAAFFWRFITPEQNMEVRNIDMQIVLPTGIPVEDMNGFVSGSIYAEKQVLEDGTFSIKAERIKPEETLDVVLLVPNQLFPEGRKIIDNFAEDAIISDMTSWESQAFRVRKEEELRFYGGWAVAILSVFLSLGTGLLLYLNKGRRPKITRQGKAKGLPALQHTPAELGALLNWGKVGVRDFYTTVIHLIQSGYLELHFDEKGVGSFALVENAPVSKLQPHEEYALKWLIMDLGNGRSLSLEAFEQLLSEYSKSRKRKASTWEALVYRKFKKWNYEESIRKNKAWSMGAVLIGILSAFLSAFVLRNLLAGGVTALFSAALAIYVIPLRKISEQAYIHIDQWNQFKEYLDAQLSMSTTKLSLDIWEQYLVYSIPLGMAEDILEKLPGICKANAFEDGNLTLLYKANHKWLSETLDKLK